MRATDDGATAGSAATGALGAGTTSTPLQAGHLTFFPASSALTFNRFPHEQAITTGSGLWPFAGAAAAPAGALAAAAINDSALVAAFFTPSSASAVASLS